MIDSQSVKTTEPGGPRGYDAGKKTKGRKRHIITHTDGNLVHVLISPNIQDRDGGYQGSKLKTALAMGQIRAVEIIKRSDKAIGFELLPRRWVVERTFSWLGRNRRLAKDFKHSIKSATGWLFIASVQLLIRKIATLRY